ncbi:MAG: GntR family transcriptional regulator [Opitutales bacterium]
MPPKSPAVPATRTGTPPGKAAENSIYELLRDRIIAWRYPPGYHLGEQQLCEEFAVSRVPIREALRALTADGFVVKKPNQGCFVKQLNVEEAKELFEVRVALECHIVEQLARRNPDRVWLERERAIWRNLLENPESGEVYAFVKMDNAFHLGLARALGNRRILAALEEVTERLGFMKLCVEASEERLVETAAEHLAILDAIGRQDASAAREAIRRNIDHSSNRVEIAISRALMAAHAM